jgi:hypothetical protein
MITNTEASARLAATAAGIGALVSDLSAQQARWKPDAASWSVLEVICHLVDEEREDFRQHIDLTLHHPDAPIPPIAPKQWVTERAYNARDPREMAAQFQAERAQSLAWLGTLAGADWNRTCTHPRLQAMRAGDFLASWVAHDLLHLRQLIELRYALASNESDPYSVEYAGEW